MILKATEVAMALAIPSNVGLIAFVNVTIHHFLALTRLEVASALSL